MRAPLALCALALLPACSLALDFDQCRVDSDCVRFRQSADDKFFCTGDHICTTDFPTDRICKLSPVSSNKAGAITVAGLFRQTDPDNGPVDTDLEIAVELAVEEINTNATRPLRLVLCDTAGDAAQAKKALITAVDQFGAVAGVGPTSSSEVVALAEAPDELVARRDFLIVSCSSTAPRVTSLADDNLIWRTAANDNLQAQVLATLIPTTTTKVASAYIDSTYGLGLNDAFAAALLGRSPPLQPTPMKFAENTAGTAVVSFLQTTAPQVALIVADSDAPTWVAALNNGGAALDMTQFLLTDGSKSTSLFSKNPSTSVLMRVKGTAPATPSGPAFDIFKPKYMSRNVGVDPGTTAFVSNAYDAMYALAIAMGGIRPGATVGGRALIPGMQALSDPNGLPIRVGPGQFGDAYQRLADGGTVNLEGTSGPIDFDPATGDIISAPIEIWDVDTTGATPTFRTLQNITP